MAVFLLSVIIIIIYSNSFHCSWHLDDKPNIINRERIHLSEFSWDSLSKAFFQIKQDNGHQYEKLYRPLSCISLALNWYVGGSSVFGYHVVNVSIHIITAIFLFLTLLTLFDTPKLKDFPQDKAYFIALLGATLWAIHPIQVSSVTYIVQRMAALAAMFSVIGFFLYLKARLASDKTNILYFFLTFLAFICAVLSKENAVLFPVSILLIEAAFFHSLTRYVSNKKLVIGLLLCLCAVGMLGIFLFKGGDFLFFLDGYEKRRFTLTQRLLTEPRIILFYLSQIFYPVADRFSITHGFQLSTSLIKPWTTIPSVLVIIGLMWIGFRNIGKRPWLGFPILFYFLNHAIESTVIPLELVFEHRNYLPSLFIFLPIAFGIMKLFEKYRKKRSMYIILNSFVCLILILIGFGTYMENMDWRTNKTLWADAIEKAPESSRPSHNLGTYYFRNGYVDIAHKLFKEALELKAAKPRTSKSNLYANIGMCYSAKKEYKEATAYYKKSLSYLYNYKSVYYLTIALMNLDKWTEAEKKITKLIDISSKPKYINLQSIIYFKQDNLQAVRENCSKVLKKDTGNKKAFYYLGLVKMQQKEYLKADYFLNTVQRLKPKDIEILFARIENSVRAGEKIETQPIVKELLNKYTLPYIHKTLDKINSDPVSPPVSREIVLSALKKEMKSYVEQ